MPLSIVPPSGPSPRTLPSTSPQPEPVASTTPTPRDPSPEPPPASPLTPVARHAKPATQPFSADDSSDAIALRAAISSLQFQRVQAQKDLRTLEDIKRQAVARPDEYRQHVIATAQAKPKPPPSITATPSDHDMDHVEDDAVAGAHSPSRHDSIATHTQPASESYPVSHGSMLRPREPSKPHQSTGFPTVPLPQDVVRCPPIEWAKYHVVGESLDKIHRDQQARPGELGSNQRDSLVAAPYNPFLDKLDPQPTQQTTTARKDSGSSAPGQPSQKQFSKAAM